MIVWNLDSEHRSVIQSETCLASWQSDDRLTTYLLVQSSQSNASYCLVQCIDSLYLSVVFCLSRVFKWPIQSSFGTTAMDVRSILRRTRSSARSIPLVESIRVRPSLELSLPLWMFYWSLSFIRFQISCKQTRHSKQWTTMTQAVFLSIEDRKDGVLSRSRQERRRTSLPSSEKRTAILWRVE